MNSWLSQPQRSQPQASATVRNVLLAVATLFFALAYLATLPPYEGFDEVGHYSYAREIADAGDLPRYGISKIDQQTLLYRQRAPFFYVIDTHFFKTPSLTYPEFFASPDLQRRYLSDYRDGPDLTRFQSSAIRNWQAQHPPLYYAVLASALKGTQKLGLSFVDSTFVLRLISFLLAYAGLLIGMKASLDNAAPELRPTLAKTYLLYPLLMPMFIPGFARLGNDSLSLFLMGTFWWYFLRWERDENALGAQLGIGISLALGLLTKALFLPLTAGFCCFVALRLWKDRANRTLCKNRIDALSVILTPVLFASIWYVFAYLRTGAITNYSVFIDFDQRSKDLVYKWLYEPFSWNLFFRHFSTSLSSWIWLFPSQSAAKLPLLLRAPLYVLPCWLLLIYARRLHQYPWTSFIWSPIWLVGPLAIGLVAIVLLFALDQQPGSIPGWYLHVGAPAVGYAFALSFQDLNARPSRRRWVQGLLLYSVAILGVALWAQMALFSGCAIEKAPTDRLYLFEGNAYCLDRFPEIMRRLSLLGWPTLGLASYALGAALFLVCLL